MQSSKSPCMIVVVILSLCVLLLTGCTTVLLPTLDLFLLQIGDEHAPATTMATATTLAQPDLPVAWIDRTALGNPDAPVTVEAYEDFLCPHCGEWNRAVMPPLMAQYIQAGTVRFVFHNFPLQGFAPGSQMAALASQCAADQGLFWPYHDYLLSVQSRGQSAFVLDQLLSSAAQIGADIDLFATCMNNVSHQELIQQTAEEGIERGVTGTPAIFVNGVLVQSAFETVQAEIDRLLADKQ